MVVAQRHLRPTGQPRLTAVLTRPKESLSLSLTTMIAGKSSTSIHPDRHYTAIGGPPASRVTNIPSYNI
jgi:hypothetical protein